MALPSQASAAKKRQRMSYQSSSLRAANTDTGALKRDGEKKAISKLKFISLLAMAERTLKAQRAWIDRLDMKNNWKRTVRAAVDPKRFSDAAFLCNEIESKLMHASDKRRRQLRRGRNESGQ